MIIYLFGPDSYRRQAKLKEVVAGYKQKHLAVTIDDFYLSFDNSQGVDFSRLQNFIRNQSLFDDFKLAIVRLGDKPPHESLSELLKFNLDSRNIILLLSAEKKFSKEFGFLLRKPVISQKFDFLSSVQLKNFVRKEMLQRNLKLSQESIDLLIQANGPDLWGVINDLNKLELGGVMDSTVIEPAFFSLIHRVCRGDIAALERLISSQEPAAIFNILASRAEGSLKTKMADYDAAIKSGKLGYVEALTDLALATGT